MSLTNLLKLVLLGAIWGASFLFMRISVPAFGPVLLIWLRVGLGALFLFFYCWAKKIPLKVADNWQQYLILGFFQSALPFLLFGYASQNASASVLSIINATAALWAALITAIYTRSLPTKKSMIGLGIGMAGVVVLVGLDSQTMSVDLGLAIAAGLAASVCYGIASVYAKHAKSVDPMANAHGALWAATLFLLPLTPFAPMHHAPDLTAILSLIVLGCICSGLAFMLFFNLIKDIGAAPTMTVAYLIPVFGVMWGALILHEHIGLNTIAGGVCILVAVALITNFNPMHVFKPKASVVG